MLVAGLVVAVYATSVVRGVGAAPPDADAASSPRDSASSSPTARPSATQSAAAASRPARIGPVREAVRTANALLVVGDSTGDGVGEWVDLWAQDLGGAALVNLHQWDAAGQRFVTSAVYGAGRTTHLWNLSYPGVRADYAERLDRVENSPDAVVINVGHDRGRVAIERAIRRTTEAVTRRWGQVPTALVLQNPSTGASAVAQEEAVATVREVAARERLAVIDVHRAFGRAGPPESLLADESTPNEQGSRVWADAVGARLS